MSQLSEINYHRLLKQVMHIGALLIESGAEIYRVEESISRMLKAYGLSVVEVFAIPTMIMVTIETPDHVSLTKTKRTLLREANFDKIARLNNLVRDITLNSPSLDIISYAIGVISSDKGYPRGVLLLSSSAVAFLFCLLTGSKVASGLVAGLIVIFTQLTIRQMEKFHANTFFVTIVASFLHTVISAGMVNYFPSLELDKMIIGTLVTILPGLTFMTAIRDLITRDLLAGILGLLEATLVATSIAIGNSIAYITISKLWEVF